MNPGKKRLLALAATLTLTCHTAAQEATKAVPVREAMQAVTNAVGEIRYTVTLDSYYTNTLVDAAREAGYVRRGFDDIQRPEVRFAADRIAALIDKKPESVQSQASTLFDIFARPQEILQLAAAEGVIDIAQREGRLDLIKPSPKDPRQIIIREAMQPVTNAAGEIKYTIRLNPFYTATLADEARTAGYVQADPEVVGYDSSEIQEPEVRFAADRIATLIGKKPEKIHLMSFVIYASLEEIVRLTAVEGVVDIEQNEGATDLVVTMGPPATQHPQDGALQQDPSRTGRWLKIRPAQVQITNEKGEVKYTVRLNPFYADELKSDAGAAGYVQARIRETGEYFLESEKPEVRFLADKIAASIGKKPAKVRSRIATEFDVYATPEEMQSLIGTEGINDISEIEGEIDVVFSQSTTIAPGDVWSGNEIIPWWKTGTNTNDWFIFQGSQNIITVIDGVLAHPISSDLNIISNTGFTTHQPNAWRHWHAAHVDGVIGAKMNNYLLRGINPGQPIRHIGIDTQNLDTITAAFQEAYDSYNATSSWGAISFSTNMGSARASNVFEFSTSLGRMMAVASNRSIILQSAGNNNSDVCGWGYQYGDEVFPYDGILLVGGHDINNQRSQDDWVEFNNGFGWGLVSGSNAGPCVELWAPSRQITSLRYNTNLTQVLSGTSFASPIAAAIAVRYGNRTTRPLEREHFLRANAHPQGNIAGQAALLVKYGNSQNKLLRHNISSIYSPQANYNTALMYNGEYGDIWNSGGNYGTIVIDLGNVKNVRHIRITPRSSVGLTEIFPIEFAVAPAINSFGSPSGTWQYRNFSKHGDMAPLTISLNGFNTRYIVLNAHNYGSWLAYSEIEVYGY